MISLTFGLLTQVSDAGPQGPLVTMCGCCREVALYLPVLELNICLLTRDGLYDRFYSMCK